MKHWINFSLHNVSKTCYNTTLFKMFNMKLANYFVIHDHYIIQYFVKLPFFSFYI